MVARMILKVALYLLCVPVLASAAENGPAPDLSAALQKAKVGSTLRVEGMGAPLVGRFDGIGRNGLELRTEQKRVAIPLESVTAVSRLESARGKGVLWGALIGVVGGIAIASQRVDDSTISEENHDALTYAYHAAVGALLGGAIGGVIGSTFDSWQPVYP